LYKQFVLNLCFQQDLVPVVPEVIEGAVVSGLDKLSFNQSRISAVLLAPVLF